MILLDIQRIIFPVVIILSGLYLILFLCKSIFRLFFPKNQTSQIIQQLNELHDLHDLPEGPKIITIRKSQEPKIIEENTVEEVPKKRSKIPKKREKKIKKSTRSTRSIKSKRD